MLQSTSKQWLSAGNLNVLDWAVSIPDLIPIESTRGILTQEIYKNGKVILIESLGKLYVFINTYNLKNKLRKLYIM